MALSIVWFTALLLLFTSTLDNNTNIILASLFSHLLRNLQYDCCDVEQAGGLGDSLTPHITHPTELQEEFVMGLSHELTVYLNFTPSGLHGTMNCNDH